MKVSEVSEIVTARVLEALENGVAAWQCPWRNGLQMSMSTRKPYRGVNQLLLGLTPYSSPWWGTYDKIAELSGFVKTPRKSGKGSYWVAPADDPSRRILKEEQKSTKIYYWELKRRKDPDHPNDRSKDFVWLYATVHSVFNAEQAASLPEKYTSTDDGTAEALPDAQAVFDDYIARGPELRFGEAAYYQHDEKMGLDRITIPPLDAFSESGKFYSTAFHEAAHSTGHPKRLKREGITEFDHFGSGKYAREELVAEMTTAMVCAMLGIEGTFDNSAAYLAGWAKKIKNTDDKNLVVTAARHAQRAVDMIMGVTYEDSGATLPGNEDS